MKIADLGAISSRSSNAKTFFTSYMGAHPVINQAKQMNMNNSCGTSFNNKSRNLQRTNSNSATNIAAT